MNPFQRLLHMFEEELYSNVNTLAQFYLTNPPHFHLQESELFSVVCLNASSLFEMKNYTEAQSQYETAVLMRRQLTKENKTVANVQEIINKFTEIELKFRIAK
jgi:hypothetical protein